MLQDFFQGLSYLRRGHTLITTSKFRHFTWLIVAVNSAVWALLVWIAWQLLPGNEPDATTNVSHYFDLSRWSDWLVTGFQTLIAVFFLILSIGLAPILVSILCIPLLDRLTMRIAQKLDYFPGPSQSLPAGIINELRKIGWSIFLILLVVLCTFIPLVNFFAPVLWFICSAWLLALTFLDYPLSYKGLRFSAVKRLLRTRRSLTLGFGAALWLIMALPIINLFAIPAAIAGATLLCHEQLRDKL